MMGGCFAQDETTRTVDTYWVAESIPIPTSETSVGIYELNNLPPTPQSSLRAFSRQRPYSGLISMFFIKQNWQGRERVPYNFYGTPGEASGFWLETNNAHVQLTINPGDIVEYSISGDVQSCPTTGSSQTVQSWVDEATITFVRLLDSRIGKKDFICCAGAVHQLFYLQACRSSSEEVAVYDVEQQTLVEI